MSTTESGIRKAIGLHFLERVREFRSWPKPALNRQWRVAEGRVDKEGRELRLQWSTIIRAPRAEDHQGTRHIPQSSIERGRRPYIIGTGIRTNPHDPRGVRAPSGGGGPCTIRSPCAGYGVGSHSINSFIMSSLPHSSPLVLTLPTSKVRSSG